MLAETVIDHAKEELLETMYRSVERMNEGIARGNKQVVLAEQILQEHLRRQFEDFERRQED